MKQLVYGLPSHNNAVLIHFHGFSHNNNLNILNLDVFWVFISTLWGVFLLSNHSDNPGIEHNIRLKGLNTQIIWGNIVFLYIVYNVNDLLYQLLS